MVTRTSSRRHSLRDIPRAFVVLIFAAFVAGVLINLNDSQPFRNPAAVNQPHHMSKAESEALLYTGSILVPAQGDLCWQGAFDNRTGRMVDKGLLNCDKAAAQLVANNRPHGMDVVRLHEIGKAFRNAGE